MSRLYFHTPERRVEVLGSEVAHMSLLATEAALAVLAPRLTAIDGRAWARSITVADYDLFGGRAWLQHWRTWLTTSWHRGELRVGDFTIGCNELAHNTLTATGSPAAMLVAKLSGDGTEHAWVAPEDAVWFADLVDAARSQGLLRASSGWEDVAQLARAVACGLPGPIVTSYSGDDPFPNRGVVGEPWFYPWIRGLDGEYLPNKPDEEAEERWDALPEAERWRLAVDGIKAREHNRQICPSTLKNRYQCGASAFDLVPEHWNLRTDDNTSWLVKA